MKNITWRDRIRAAMVSRRLNMKELSIAAGLGDTAVRDLLEGRSVHPKIETIAAIAEKLGMTVSELWEGEAASYQRIPVIGCASAGEAWEPFSDELGEFELRVEGGEPVALEVRGDSMSPVYRDGDMIIGTKRAGPSADNLIGLDCIVVTENNERYIKYLMRGQTRGRFNLRSYNPAHKDIENVRLQWAAPILWIRRSFG